MATYEYEFPEPVIDDALGEEILKKILEHNPNLWRGDTMTGPVALVDDNGEISTDPFVEPHDYKTLSAMYVKVSLPLESNSFALGTVTRNSRFIHTYNCHRIRPFGLTSASKVGDLSYEFDAKTRRVVEKIVTQEMLDTPDIAIFRYALS